MNVGCGTFRLNSQVTNRGRLKELNGPVAELHWKVRLIHSEDKPLYRVYGFQYDRKACAIDRSTERWSVSGTPKTPRLLLRVPRFRNTFLYFTGGQWTTNSVTPSGDSILLNPMNQQCS